ncbi:hypothetical protein CWM47_35345 [Spirosoma pollinicola]|uniref:Uncharacterized protein n=1 Tax=Spirosoma pollinicola TaxID=2057025 RepID=A0A2K8Z9V7_9BACT|nr:hypothetical protein CWM47_35345 [Spirosoma pollinicola]
MGIIATPFVLSVAGQTTLDELVSKGKDSVSKLNRARVLPFSYQGQHPEQNSNLLGISLTQFITCENAIERTDCNELSAKNPGPASLAM